VWKKRLKITGLDSTQEKLTKNLTNDAEEGDCAVVHMCLIFNEINSRIYRLLMPYQ